MASESYIERLQREKKQLIAAVRAGREWEEAMYNASIAGKKWDLYQLAGEKKVAKDAAFSIIEPLLAEGDKT